MLFGQYEPGRQEEPSSKSYVRQLCLPNSVCIGMVLASNMRADLGTHDNNLMHTVHKATKPETPTGV